jgi:large exoprotein involved in heme utilization and adhesion
VSADLFFLDSGNAGRIQVEASTINLAQGALVDSSALTGGRAGDVALIAQDRIDVNSSQVSAYSFLNSAGTVTLRAPRSLILRNGSLVSAKAFIHGGNIAADSGVFGMENSRLWADAVHGNGGHIDINTDFMYQFGQSDIRFDSQNQSAQPGTLSIRSAVDFGASLASLTTGLVTSQEQMREGCERRNPQANSLMVRGKGGMGVRPDGFIPVPDMARSPTRQ